MKQATSIAHHMVKECGMSDKVGLRTIESPKRMMIGESLSASTVESADSEIKKILFDSYERAKPILKTNSKNTKRLLKLFLSTL